jgi:hypothetical protein
MPNNLRSMVLPEIEELRRFPALGPEGLNECDINGRAAAMNVISISISPTIHLLG